MVGSFIRQAVSCQISIHFVYMILGLIKTLMETTCFLPPPKVCFLS